jgi:hypothetical protein
MSARASGWPSVATVDSVTACGSGVPATMATRSHSMNSSCGESGAVADSNAGAVPMIDGSARCCSRMDVI